MDNANKMLEHGDKSVRYQVWRSYAVAVNKEPAFSGTNLIEFIA